MTFLYSCNCSSIGGNIEVPDHPRPDFFVVEMKDDLRVGYWDQSIITLSWQSPHGIKKSVR